MDEDIHNQTTRVIRRAPGFRQWFDYAVKAACAGLIALVGVVYGIHVKEIDKLSARVDAVEVQKAKDSERIGKLETRDQAIAERLGSIDKRLEVIDADVKTVLQKVGK